MKEPLTAVLIRLEAHLLHQVDMLQSVDRTSLCKLDLVAASLKCIVIILQDLIILYRDAQLITK